MTIPTDERWKVNQPGSCHCPCEEVVVERRPYWPCCVFGMQAKVDIGAEDLDLGGRGLFAVTVARVTIIQQDGTRLDSLDHSGFELTQGDLVNRTRFYWGGAVHMYRFGLAFPAVDILCERGPALPCVELTLRFTNVSPQQSSCRIDVAEAELTSWFSFDDSAVHQCLTGRTGAVGTWFNTAAVCSTNPAYSIVPFMGSTELIIEFGPVNPEQVPHARIASNAPVVLAPNIMDSLPVEYQTVDGKICYGRIPCDENTPTGANVDGHTDLNDCDDVLCPPCVCQNTDDHQCRCDCKDALHPPLGKPSFLDLAKTPAPGIDVSDITFQACIASFGVIGASSICLLYGYKLENHTINQSFAEAPFEITYDRGLFRWVAHLRGIGLMGNPATFAAYGPQNIGLITCQWLPFRFEYTGFEARLTVMGQPGAWAASPPGWEGLHDIDSFWWGSHYRVQLGGVHGYRNSAHSIIG